MFTGTCAVNDDLINCLLLKVRGDRNAASVNLFYWRCKISKLGQPMVQIEICTGFP
jgi:hypothetical protein